jgi:16S rRNA G527 N7-methylase RsmG
VSRPSGGEQISPGGTGPVEHAPGPIARSPLPAAGGLREVLEIAQARGFIGGPDLDAHVRQAEAFVAAVGGAPATVLDLGSGGGLPGLVMAMRWAGTRLTLLDGSTERGAFLVDAVARLGLYEVVEVAVGRAEELGRQGALRGGFEVVVARSFGAPAVVAECGAPFLAIGGRLMVSEPPGSDGSRWHHPEVLAQLGLEQADLRSQGDHAFQVLRATRACPPRFPRRTGVPAKRPLF